MGLNASLAVAMHPNTAQSDKIDCKLQNRTAAVRNHV